MQLQVTQDDIDNIATKLDEFSAVLNDREHRVLRALFTYARRAIDAERRQEAPSARPPLSASFRKAIDAGADGVFEIGDESDEEFIKIKFHRVESPREVHKEIHRTSPKGREVHKVTHTETEGGGETSGEGELDTPVPKLP